jgi:hypothetical protein
MTRFSLKKAHFPAIFLLVWTAGIIAQTTPAAPSLTAPSNGATGEPLAIALSWGSSAGAASYEVQVSLSSTFATTILDQSGATLTGTTPGGLVNGTTYYWRANAADASGDTSWSALWSFSTIVAAPGAPLLASPTSEAGNQPISLALSWGSVAGATAYGVLVSTDVNFGTSITSQAGLSGTSAAISGLSNATTYYWKVNASNAGGTSWSNIWLFTTIVAAPPAPVPLSPASGSINEPVAPTLTWGSSAGATSYEAEASLSSTFGATIFDQSAPYLVSTALSGLASSTTIYWRAAAANAGGKTWSAAQSFTTVEAAPGTPVLVSPASGAVNQPLTLGLTWNSLPTATVYEVQVSLSSTFGVTVFDQSGSSLPAAQVTGLANGATYYWRVDAANIGGSGPWSAIGSFTTIVAAPLAPVLASPASGTLNQTISSPLSWNSVTGATAYTVQVSTDVNFGTVTFSQTGAALTTATPSGLAATTLYFWRVNAANIGGASWSGIWIFTTVATAPAAPVLASPTNGAGNQPLMEILSWGSSGSATAYEVQVSLSNLFTTTLFDQTGAALTSAIVAGLPNATTCYWRASASNAGGTRWSSIWMFTTLPAAPAAPLLATPTNGAGNLPLSPMLSWSSVAGATYGMQVSTDVNFGTTVCSQAGIAALSAAATGLANNTAYYWRASATNAGGTAWSNAWSFVTVPLAPVGPALSSPANSATGQASTVILSWNTVGGATAYTVQVATGSAFAVPLFTQTGPLPMAAVTGLSYAGTYYWRAGATNAEGTGWATAWSFMTLTAPGAPTMVSPSNSALFNNRQALTLTWTTSATATSYGVEVSTDMTFATTTLAESGLTATTCLFTPATGVPNYWRVAATNAAGTTWSVAQLLLPSVSVLSSLHAAASVSLAVKSGSITYSLPKAERVELSLYDILGRTALTLDRVQGAGSYAIDLKGKALAAGRYIVSFRAGSFEKQSVVMVTR